MTRFLLLAVILVPMFVRAIPLEDLAGTWERYSEDGLLAERLTASIDPQLGTLITQIQYFQQKQPVGSGVSLLDKHNDQLGGVMRFSNGLVMRIDVIEELEKGFFFEMMNIQAEPLSMGYSEFMLQELNGKMAIIQRVYKDKNKAQLLREGHFYQIK